MALTDEVRATIWGQHRETMFARVDLIASSLLDGSRRTEARDAAHQLAGTVGSFGFPRASDIARQLETLLADGTDDRITMSRLVGELRADLEDPPFIVKVEEAPKDDAPPNQAPLPLVLLCAMEKREAERLRVEAGRRGLSVGTADHLSQVGERVARDRPDVLVLDLGAEPQASAPLLTELCEQHAGMPVIVLAEEVGFAARVDVARTGAAALIDRGSAPSEVMDQVALALQRRALVGARVLMLGSSEAARQELVGAGLELEVASDPAFLWQDLQRVAPALIVVAGAVGDVDAHELCRVLRNAPRWAVVPVVMLADDPERAFAVGADDCVRPEAVAPELAARVRSHLERFRMHQALAETDALTGLQNRRTASAAISGLVRMAERLSKPMCVVQIDIDRFKQINDLHGHLAGDAVLRRLGEILRRSFRGEDVLARWGGEEFVLGLFGTDRDRALDRVSEVLSAFRAEEFGEDSDTFTVTFSAGVAQFPDHGADLEALYLATDEALYAAKTGGRDQIVSAGDNASTQQVDIAIIEDEDAASELMSHILTERGHRCYRFSNGAGAAAMLAGDVPKVRARVILLDLNMPALDGVELLSILRRDDILRSTKVIIITARDDSDSRIRTVYLGASDYLRKPVDDETLIKAVDKALGRS